MRYLFGQDFELAPIRKSKDSRSALHKTFSYVTVHCAHEGDGDIKHDADYGVNSCSMGWARSETSVNAEGCQHLEGQWVPRQVKSDSGVEMDKKARNERMMPQPTETTRMLEELKKDMQWIEYTSTSPEKATYPEDHGHDRCAMTTITTTTTTYLLQTAL